MPPNNQVSHQILHSKLGDISSLLHAKKEEKSGIQSGWMRHPKQVETWDIFGAWNQGV